MLRRTRVGVAVAAFSAAVPTTGGGQQIGYDDRYYDPRGRTLYVKAELAF